MQEEILLHRSKTGTKIHYFNTDIDEYNYSVSTSPAVLKIGTENIEISSLDGVVFYSGSANTVKWERSGETEYFSKINSSNELTPDWSNVGNRMNFVVGAALPNPLYITGRTFSNFSELQLSSLKTDSIERSFKQSMDRMFTAGTSSYVFFEDSLYDDYIVNLKLEKTFDVLNTLNIYNKVSGEGFERESETGVVFGKLEAIQKLSDENGNRIRIPLRNVPVGIFNTSPDYPDANSTDADGNRLRLNYRPLSVSEINYPTAPYSLHEYFNQETANFDNQFLTSPPLDGVNIHPTFKNVVYTNDNGEFFIHNVDVGGQILFFEVDLLKQGLTKDEVALNFFPYPPNFDNISIDTIPHYFYRAIPIDVVPTWGPTFQTGYTEVNISVNLDLRKWATYIFPPVSFKGYPIDSSEYYDISRAPLTVKVRDMSKWNTKALMPGGNKSEVYPSKQIQMVEIQDIVDKSEDQQWEYSNEFSQIKDKAIFHTYGYHAIKLPANIYVSDEYKRDAKGYEMIYPSQKGLWLCTYQLKIFLTKEKELYRSTGLGTYYGNGSWYDRDHFHMCLNNNISSFVGSNKIMAIDAIADGVEAYPYEKAWSAFYPEKFSIPKFPKDETYSSGRNYNVDKKYLETPKFKDGDAIFGDTYNGFNGFGCSVRSKQIQYTDFSTDITGGPGGDMYKYERLGVEPFGSTQYFGTYSNGYSNSFDNLTYSNSVTISRGDFTEPSNVLDGERFQRVEAGYGYFLYPSTMPRVFSHIWYADNLSGTEVDSGLDQTKDNWAKAWVTYSEQNSSEFAGWYSPAVAMSNHYISFSVHNNGKSIAMDLSKKGIDGQNPIINDKLNIYRIVNGKTKVNRDKKQPTIPTYAKFGLGYLFFTKGKDDDNGYWPVDFVHWNLWNNADSKNTHNTFFKLKVTNTGNEELEFDAFGRSFVVDKSSCIVLYTTNGYNSSSESPPDGYYGAPNGNNVKWRFPSDPAGEWRINPHKEGFTNFSTTFVIKGNAAYNDLTNKFDKVGVKFELYSDWGGGASGFRNLNKSDTWFPIKNKNDVYLLPAYESSNVLTYNACTTWVDVKLDWYGIGTADNDDVKSGWITTTDTDKGVGEYGQSKKSPLSSASMLGIFNNPGNYYGDDKGMLRNNDVADEGVGFFWSLEQRFLKYPTTNWKTINGKISYMRVYSSNYEWGY